MRLSSVAFGISLGIITGLCMMLLSWICWWWGYGAGVVDQWGSVYPGFDASLKGGFMGFAWGFLEGLVLGVVWGWIYNMCLCGCRCCSCCCHSDKSCKPKL
jgi:hypothetical protein